jgi:hypothetical protein
MLGWLRRRRERSAWIEAEAEALSRELGVEAYSEARRREREANSIAEARQYNRVALAIAGRTCNAVGAGAGARLASDALLASTFETPARRQGAPLPDEGQIGEIRSAASDGTLAQFRLQFLAVADDRTLKVVKEHEVHASDVPGAIRRAVQIEWPPRAIGFKLIDRDGQQVFGRQSGDRGS